jgi:hypothetical protein
MLFIVCNFKNKKEKKKENEKKCLSDIFIMKVATQFSIVLLFVT